MHAAAYTAAMAVYRDTFTAVADRLLEHFDVNAGPFVPSNTGMLDD